MNIHNKTQKALYILLSCTWGILMTLVGAIVAFTLILSGHRPRKFGWNIYFMVGKNWGGLELGPFFLVDSLDTYSVKCHEHGHGFQNIVMGPFYIFIVALRSALRYWLYNIESYDNRAVFEAITTAALFLISLILLSLSILYNIIPCIIIMSIVFLFIVYDLIWFNQIEFPKFINKETFPMYDDFWPEGQASKWGERFIDK